MAFDLLLLQLPLLFFPFFEILTASRARSRSAKTAVVGIRTLPHYKFVWNEFLLDNFETRVHSSWVLHIIHGFVSQGDLEVFGRSIFITLVARFVLDELIM